MPQSPNVRMPSLNSFPLRPPAVIVKKSGCERGGSVGERVEGHKKRAGGGRLG